MNKSFYFIECVCIKNCIYPNVEFHVGDVVYYNKNASSNEMYLWNYKDPIRNNIPNNINKKYCSIGSISYLPFTKQKRYAKKYKNKKYLKYIVEVINKNLEFTATIKEIKVIYEEELDNESNIS